MDTVLMLMCFCSWTVGTDCSCGSGHPLKGSVKPRNRGFHIVWLRVWLCNLPNIWAGALRNRMRRRLPGKRLGTHPY